jgi:hypothetical protein
VGTGQLVNMQENEEYNYRRQLEQADRLGNQEALQALREIGPPPYSEFSSLLTLCHHFVVMNRPDAFLRELLAHVRPLLLVPSAVDHTGKGSASW